MTRLLKLLVYFSGSAFVLGALVYLALHEIMPGGYVFGALYRRYQYHLIHPFQYIAVVALSYATVATLFVLRWPGISGWRRHIGIIVVMLSSIILASIPGGILWKLHDMQAGFFTSGIRFWSDLAWGAAHGLLNGWVIIALSIPYNLIGLVVGYLVTRHGLKIR